MEILKEKRTIEAQLEHGDDQKTKAAYISLLASMNRQFCGILDFRWPGVPAPLYMRCGSSDFSNFIQIFRHNEYGFPIAFSPKRILDLGAYVGFASTYLALRFPDAEIVSVEPSGANFQLLSLNTGTYSRIRRLNVAVWGHSSNLDLTAHAGGDWGVRLAESSSREGGIPALSVPDILAAVNWDSVDFLKCDIEGAEVSVFGETGGQIAGYVNCCAIETHDAVAPRSSAIVKACFDPDHFSSDRSGEFDVFLRREPRNAFGPAAKRISLFRPSGGPRAISLRNVPTQIWGYYMYDVDSCQLHPNNRGEPLAEISTAIDLNGQTVFDCEVSVANPLGQSVDFMIEVFCETIGRQVALSEITVKAGEKLGPVIKLLASGRPIAVDSWFLPGIGLVSPDCHTERSIGTWRYVADSGATISLIHGRSACRGLTDAAIRTARRSVGADQAPVAGTRRLGRGDRGGQSAVRGGGAVSLPYRDAVARPAGAVRRRDKGPPAVQPLGQKRGLGAGVSASRR
jgi:FkbM family methyltransferase